MFYLYFIWCYRQCINNFIKWNYRISHINKSLKSAICYTSYIKSYWNDIENTIENYIEMILKIILKWYYLYIRLLKLIFIQIEVQVTPTSILQYIITSLLTFIFTTTEKNALFWLLSTYALPPLPVGNEIVIGASKVCR